MPLGYTSVTQPRRVGSFSGGPADLQGGPIFVSNAEKQESKREQGGSTLAGGPGPCGLPRRYGAASVAHLSFLSRITV